jgi:hypothetical protein
MPHEPQTCKKYELNLELTPNQIAELEPIIQHGGKVAFTGAGLDGNRMSISYVACNAAFFIIKAAAKK